MQRMESEEQKPQRDNAAKESKPDKLGFLIRDYELKINYLTNQYTRMWTRFNFFLVVETGLSAALFGFFKPPSTISELGLFLALIGAVSSLCWYVFGAQDRYLAAVYRTHVEEAGSKISEKLELEDYLGYPYIPVVYQETEIDRHIYQWRADIVSTTKLAAWFPLLVFIYWLLVLNWMR
jgi:hypothetical protein